MRTLRLLFFSVVGLAGAYGLYLRSDAHRNGNRLFYRDGRPNLAGRAVGRAWAFVSGLGLTPSWGVVLETTGHRTGRVSSIPLVIGEHGGERYLVSMLGERSPWVRNVRAAGGRAVIRHGRRREVRLVEVPPDQRAPVIKAYLTRAIGARPHIPVDPAAPIEAFEPIAGAYPVFRIDGSGWEGEGVPGGVLSATINTTRIAHPVDAAVHSVAAPRRLLGSWGPDRPG